ncbi:MAG: MmgE/PrpD family protein [Synergistetes bacterium]|nr:MmgE/PrpD family protein [Synergistota bacterium]
MRSYTELFSSFVTSLKWSDLPEKVKHQAKRCFLDAIGVTIAGSFYSDTAKVVKSLTLEFQEREESTIIGTNFKRSTMTAAFANGAMAHALELDDGSREATYHPASSIIPASFALAEKLSKGGKDLLEAIVCGYEVSIRIGSAINPHHYLKGFHPTGTIAVFGTTVSSAKLLNLNEEQTVNALGIAGSMACGINQYEIDGSNVKHLHPANAARNGILAALLALKGMQGPRFILEGKLGFFNCYAQEFKKEELSRNLGNDFQILKVYFKPYPSCRYVHYAVEAIQEIKKNHGVRTEDVEKINIKTHLNAKQGSDIPDYRTPLHARLSIQYGVASMLIRGKAGLREYTEESIKDERVRELARRITIEVDPEIQKLYPNPRSLVLEVKTRSGETFSYRVDYPKGDPENPMSDEELEEKFLDITEEPLGKKKALLLLEKLWNIDKVKDVEELSKLLMF